MSLSEKSRACHIGRLKSQPSVNEVPSGTIQFDLRRHYYTISTSMSAAVVEQIAYLLYSARILTQHELNVVVSRTEILSKASELLSAVIRKGQKACGIFLQALKTCDPHLSEQLGLEQANSSSKMSPVSLLKPPSHTPTPVVCNISICNSNLNNCTFGSGNNVSVTTTMPLSNLNHIEEPPMKSDEEYGNCNDAASDSHMCRVAEDTDTNSTGTIQTDIAIVSSRLTNVTVGESNVLTMVEELSNEEELEGELEEHDCKEKVHNEQSITPEAKCGVQN
ncbi:uncharacterized protein si:dkey-29h14.10 [Leucoraja erinacea]|uniref:uncharacterized protein si:dkey-29h14.10 n=1 Tax=Leucoraja erinaceus TaxID=7782 RepID=UPI00245719BB|nr:uncharacterized protein si:dkey-29h14.10 [Leucoraja erinacea]